MLGYAAAAAIKCKDRTFYYNTTNILIVIGNTSF